MSSWHHRCADLLHRYRDVVDNTLFLAFLKEEIAPALKLAVVSIMSFVEAHEDAIFFVLVLVISILPQWLRRQYEAHQGGAQCHAAEGAAGSDKELRLSRTVEAGSWWSNET
jgi:hypothetical protein